jgi:hypothetical protein
MAPANTDTQHIDEGGFEWDDSLIEIKPKQLKEEPPLGELHEDDWAWLVLYKYYEWLKIVVQSRLPGDERQPEQWEQTFVFVKHLNDQGIPLEQWTGRMPFPAANYASLNKQLTEEQKAYLQDVATGVIYPSFPDPSDEAEEHRGKPRQWS